ncbi:uncharacterized protein LOC120430246 isoform X3 [Culex pipiens pallens]|uniref:uncharacterized protein LOC120430246 isoform X3 n=1 Tax=Culex pipiens pallens TaxID=42434 RepID=UPI001952F79C|nr:uncharacterized protein LOC120430246 isoform X3 [Culex pipiens pallens]
MLKTVLVPLEESRCIMASYQMSSKSYELSSVHTDVQCNGCDRATIQGLRYACLVCEDYDECDQCRQDKRTSRKHRPYHPVQPILPPAEMARSMECVRSPQTEIRIYCCPHCGDTDFNVRDLTEHCQQYHADGGRGHKVRCPICVTFRVPYRRKFRLEDCTLLRHLLEDHRDVESAVQASHEGDCAICMDDVTLSASRKFLPCGHAFHGHCIGRWLRSNNSCPVCRAEVSRFFMM